jgi:hypothetical protein
MKRRRIEATEGDRALSVSASVKRRLLHFMLSSIEYYAAMENVKWLLINHWIQMLALEQIGFDS